MKLNRTELRQVNLSQCVQNLKWLQEHQALLSLSVGIVTEGEMEGCPILLLTEGLPGGLVVQLLRALAEALETKLSAREQAERNGGTSQEQPSHPSATT